MEEQILVPLLKYFGISAFFLLPILHGLYEISNIKRPTTRPAFPYVPIFKEQREQMEKEKLNERFQKEFEKTKKYKEIDEKRHYQREKKRFALTEKEWFGEERKEFEKFKLNYIKEFRIERLDKINSLCYSKVIAINVV